MNQAHTATNDETKISEPTDFLFIIITILNNKSKKKKINNKNVLPDVLYCFICIRNLKNQ